MKIYLVGGAVRDRLLGRPIHEKDWVVVGGTPQELLDLGFRPVGKDFPVFLHPETHEEYALARTERKIALGYKGFQFYTSPDVTLEEDLARRDLTINAIAQTDEGQIIDPFNGKKDLEDRVLRHVSPAFVEDPVRILRIARFAARFGDFTVYPTTCEMMKTMVSRGEVNTLVSERVWQEWVRALAEPYPERFFELLINCGAFEILFPEFKSLEKEFIFLKNAVKHSANALVRFSVLFQRASLKNIITLCKRYRVPREYADLATLLAKYYEIFDNINEADANLVLNLLENLDAFRRPDRLTSFLCACKAVDSTPNDKKSQKIQKAYALSKSVDTEKLIQQGLVGPQISEALRKERIKAINSA